MGPILLILAGEEFGEFLDVFEIQAVLVAVAVKPVSVLIGVMTARHVVLHRPFHVEATLPVAAHFSLIAGHERADKIDFAWTVAAASLAVEVSSLIEVRRANEVRFGHRVGCCCRRGSLRRL